MTFVATCLAGIMTYSIGSFDPFLFILTMIGLIIAHTASNMTNDWYDVKHGVDENAPTAQYRPHPLLFGEVDKGTYKMVIFAQFAVGLAISAYLTWLQGLPVMVFSVLGVLFSVFYTADPIMLKHHTLGEISVFLAFGPLMVGGAFYAISGQFSWDPLLASTPIGLLIALVLLANNLRDKSFHHRGPGDAIFQGIDCLGIPFHFGIGSIEDILSVRSSLIPVHQDSDADHRAVRRKSPTDLGSANRTTCTSVRGASHRGGAIERPLLHFLLNT